MRNLKLILAIAFAFMVTTKPVNAAFIQWNLENVNSYACINPGICGLKGGPSLTDTISGLFVYNTTSDTIPHWNIISQNLGTFSDGLGNISFNDSPSGTASFERFDGGGVILELVMPSPNIPLLSDTSPITLSNSTFGVVVGGFGYDYTGTLVSSAVTPIPSTLSLFTTALVILGLIGTLKKLHTLKATSKISR